MLLDGFRMEKLMKDELMIKCLENSLWAQYIIEFFKFVGFSVSKETYGDLAKNIDKKLEGSSIEINGVLPKEEIDDLKPEQQLYKVSYNGFTLNQVNVVIENVARSKQNEETNTSMKVVQKTECASLPNDACAYEVVTISYSEEKSIEIEKKENVNSNAIYIIKIRVDETVYWDKAIRLSIMKAILNELNGVKQQDRDSLQFLYSKYEKYDVFYHLYNEGLLKYTEDYYNGSGKSNGFREVIKEACESSKASLAKCFNELISGLKKEDNHYAENKYIRYVVLLLKYKINDLRYSLEKKNTFWPRKMLEEIDDIIREYPYFMRACYLAALICRSEYQLNNRFIYYINKALKAVDEGDYSRKTKSFLYYQLAKYYEGHNYSVDIIKEAYEQSVQYDSASCFAQYKKAEYAYKTGKNVEIDGAIETLKELEESIVDHFDEKKLMPKRRIHGYRCCAFLGNIEYNLQHYDRAKEYYEKAIKLAIRQSNYFKNINENGKNNWYEVFFMCMPLTPVTRNMMRIYGSEQKTSNEAEILRRTFFKEKLETELLAYWKKKCE